MRSRRRVDIIAVTHGHGDHAGDTVDLTKGFLGVSVVAQVELKSWLQDNGAVPDGAPGNNQGASRDIAGSGSRSSTFHSSSADGEGHTGEACGIVIRLEDGKTVLRRRQCVFGDMALIVRIYAPDVAVLPIGDFFTMGLRERGRLELLGNPRCVLCHWGLPVRPARPTSSREAPGDRRAARARRLDRARSSRRTRSRRATSSAGSGESRPVEVSRGRLGRAVGRAEGRRRRDAGVRQPAVRARRARRARRPRRRPWSSPRRNASRDGARTSHARRKAAARAPPTPAASASSGPAASRGRALRRRGTSSSPPRPSRRSRTRSARRRAGRSRSGCSSASQRPRPPRCSSSRRTAATQDSPTSRSTSASTTTRHPSPSSSGSSRHTALFGKTLRGGSTSTPTLPGVGGAPQRFGFGPTLEAAFVRWAATENLEERVDGVERIDPVVLAELRRR